MRNFRSVVVLRRPRAELWTIMRDHLAAFAASVADIGEVRQIERVEAADGTVRIANRWQVQRPVPPSVRAMLKIDTFAWIDRNVWDQRSHTCRWSIEPTVLGEHASCRGETLFEVAMGGRGTRVTFSGELDVKPGLVDALGSVGPMVIGSIEPAVSTIVPRNLRAVAEAAAAFALPVAGARSADEDAVVEAEPWVGERG